MTHRCIKKTLYNNVYSQLKPPINKSPSPPKKRWASAGLPVYEFVFATKVAFGAAMLLCISLLLQPVAFAYANDADGDEQNSLSVFENQSATESETLIPAEQQMPALIDESPDVLDDGDDQTDVSNTTMSDQVDDLVTVEAPVTNPNLPTDLEGSLEPNPDQVLQNQTLASTSNSQTSQTEDDQQPTLESYDALQNETSTTTKTVVDAISSVATTSSGTNGSSTDFDSANQEQNTEGEVQSNSTSDSSTTTDSNYEAGQETILVSTFKTDSVFAFNKNECTEVADGSFYCQKLSYDSVVADDLFAAPDSDGDMEIYINQGGVQHKITDNAVDDASPHYDARSKTIVWHRLINDRYQIVSYDVETGKEDQITFTTVNNMEPTRSGDYIVWQRWIENNWEIILLDGNIETQITDSVEHDIAPHIRGDLIIWNVRSSDGTQSLMTYDISSQVFNEINDADGVSVSNPRMLVMYEAQYNNGDTVMKGFDLVTGEIIPIEHLPRDLPTELPSPEPTGEVRALPNAQQTEEEFSSDSDIDTDEPSTATTTKQLQSGDLVLTDTVIATTSAIHNDVEYELDLRLSDEIQTSSTTSSFIQQAVIPDVVIPVYSQETVENQASSTQVN